MYIGEPSSGPACELEAHVLITNIAHVSAKGKHNSNAKIIIASSNHVTQGSSRRDASAGLQSKLIIVLMKWMPSAAILAQSFVIAY